MQCCSIFVFIIFIHLSTAKVLIIGATGRVGFAVCKGLLNQGIDINCLVRNEQGVNKLKLLQSENSGGLAQCFLGDVTDVSSIVKASEGCTVIKHSYTWNVCLLIHNILQAIIACHGVRPPRFSRIYDVVVHPRNFRNHPYSVNYIGIKNVLAAMKVNNVDKLVRITGSLCGKSCFLPFVALFNILLSVTAKWHERAEIAIRNSGVNYTVLRPPEISNEESVRLQNNRSLVLLNGDSGERAPLPGRIPVDDLADICIKAVTDNRLSRSSIIVSSQAGKGPTTWDLLLPKVIHPILIFPALLSLDAIFTACTNRLNQILRCSSANRMRLRQHYILLCLPHLLLV